MKVKFVSTTNEMAEPIVGKECELDYLTKAHFEYDPTGLGFDYRKGEWHTSLIENINIREETLNYYIITIDTRNSQYIFSKGEISEKRPLTKEEIIEQQIAFGMHLF